jgi:hypothetical protein
MAEMVGTMGMAAMAGMVVGRGGCCEQRAEYDVPTEAFMKTFVASCRPGLAASVFCLAVGAASPSPAYAYGDRIERGADAGESLLVAQSASLAERLIGRWEADFVGMIEQSEMTDEERALALSLMGNMIMTVDFRRQGVMVSTTEAMGETETETGTWVVTSEADGVLSVVMTNADGHAESMYITFDGGGMWMQSVDSGQPGVPAQLVPFRRSATQYGFVPPPPTPPSCEAVPDLRGVPSGSDGFDLYGSGELAGATRYLVPGDNLMTWSGEGGIGAMTLWAEDECGLWIRDARRDSGIELDVWIEPETRVEFVLLQRLPDGGYILDNNNTDTVYTDNHDTPRLRIDRGEYSAFEVTLLDDIAMYEGE